MKQVLRTGFVALLLAIPVVVAAQSFAITRADFVVNMMASKGLGGSGGFCFPDVTNQAFAPAVCEAKSRGYVRGYGDGKFHPFQEVTLIDAAVMAMRAEGISLPSDTIWYRPAIEKLADWDAIPDSISSIAMPLSVSQANDVLVSVRHRRGNDDNNDDNVEHDDDNDDLTVSITESDNTVDAGDTVTYRIRIVNDDNDDVSVDVRAELDNDMTFVSASDDGDENDDEVEWDNVDIDGDDDITLTLTVRMRSSLDDGDTVVLRVEADNEVDEEETEIGDGGSNNDGNGDISLSIDDSDDPVEPGDTVTYRIRLENNGNSDERIDVRADLDNDMTFVSASNSGDRSGDRVDWDNIRVDEDETVTLLLTVRTDSSLDDGDSVRLSVRAAGETETEDTDIDDNGNSNNNNDNDQDVTISISEVEDPVEEGQVITYRVRITNNENNPILIDPRATLDDDTSFVSASDNGELHSDDEVRWENISIARDETKTLLLSVRPRSTVRDGDSVTVTVEAGDNEDTEETKIEDNGNNGNGDIQLSITDSDDPVQPGDTVTYRIRIENLDNDDTSADVRARLDGDMTFVSANEGGDEIGTSEVRWDNVDIHGDDDITLELRVRIRASADDGDTVRLDVEADNEVESESTDIED